jgi:hypothetical protein
VDQFKAIDADYEASMCGDNLHPNGPGNQTMAKLWLDTIYAFPGMERRPLRFNFWMEIPSRRLADRSFASSWRVKNEPFTADDLQLIEQGYHVVIAPGDVSSQPSGNANIDAAYNTLTKTHGFSKTLSMASMSRETLALFRWASSNPEKVESMHADNDVCNLMGWPEGELVRGRDSKGSGGVQS